MIKDDCIFCKIANGEIPTNTLYEDNLFRVIFDASPATKGHALIIPKSHYANLLELDVNEASKVLPLAQKIASAMKEELDWDGMNLVQNNEEVAGQTVFHFHMHIIPRYKNDGNKIGWHTNEPDTQLLKTLAEKFSKRFSE